MSYSQSGPQNTEILFMPVHLPSSILRAQLWWGLHSYVVWETCSLFLMGFIPIIFSCHVKHQIVNSLNHANIFCVCTVKSVQYISARKVVKVQLTLSQGTLARHNPPLSGQTWSSWITSTPQTISHIVWMSCLALGVAKTLQSLKTTIKAEKGGIQTDQFLTLYNLLLVQKGCVF